MSVHPTDAALSKKMQAIGDHVDQLLTHVAGERMGFVLMVRPFERTGRAGNYVSNIDPAQVAGFVSEASAQIQGSIHVPLHEGSH